MACTTKTKLFLALSIIFALCISIVALSVSLSACRSASAPRVTSPLPAPTITKLVLYEPAGLRAEWKPLNYTGDKPSLGYKLNLWEPEIDKSYSVDINNTFVEVLTPVNRPLDEVPHSKPIVVVVGASATSASYEHLQPSLKYQVRLQAFTAEGDGPLSAATAVQRGAPAAGVTLQNTTTT